MFGVHPFRRLNRTTPLISLLRCWRDDGWSATVAWCDFDLAEVYDPGGAIITEVMCES